jgi:hypothetical protein
MKPVVVGREFEFAPNPEPIPKVLDVPKDGVAEAPNACNMSEKYWDFKCDESIKDSNFPRTGLILSISGYEEALININSNFIQ